jgi:two-component system response regulator LytT
MMVRILFIDDNPQIIGAFRRLFSNYPNVVFAECHSVEEALQAIEEHKPDIIFLDHHLTRNGDEGLEIADRIGSSIKVYSTTSDESFVSEYRKRGIEVIGKDIVKIYRIIKEMERE